MQLPRWIQDKGAAAQQTGKRAHLLVYKLSIQLLDAAALKCQCMLFAQLCDSPRICLLQPRSYTYKPKPENNEAIHMLLYVVLKMDEYVHILLLERPNILIYYYCLGILYYGLNLELLL